MTRSLQGQLAISWSIKPFNETFSAPNKLSITPFSRPSDAPFLDQLFIDTHSCDHFADNW